MPQRTSENVGKDIILHLFQIFLKKYRTNDVQSNRFLFRIVNSIGKYDLAIKKKILKEIFFNMD
jgi:hypothetical protein